MASLHDKPAGFQVAQSKSHLWKILLYTVLMTIAILAVLPFTQALSGDPRDRTFREVNVANIPPPEPPPPEPPPPEEEEEEQETPDIQEPPQMLDLSQLESALNPGTGGAFQGAFDLNAFSVNPNVAGEMQIFDIADLDRRPRMVKRVLPEYPQELQVKGIEGSVTLVVIIDKNGEVTVEKVLDYEGSEKFVQPTRLALSRCRYEPPTKDGKAVNVRYQITIPFNL